ncbi:MAG: hypothetical protein B6I38_10215, partial [Anaerolineaceae bacterium 4572_5.1]
LRYTDPSGHYDIEDPGSIYVPPPPPPSLAEWKQQDMAVVANQEMPIDDGGDFTPPHYDHEFARNAFLNLDRFFDPFNVPPDNQSLLFEVGYELYGGKLVEKVIEACRTDNCNNPLGYKYESDDSFQKLGAESKTVLASYMTTQLNDYPTRVFLGEVGVDLRNRWNFEPHWVYTLQTLKPMELRSAKMKFLLIYATSPDVYKAFEEGASAVGSE